MFNDCEYDFEKELSQKQIELELDNTSFANYIGMHRTWLINLWNKRLPKHPLSKKTMSKLYNRLGISFETMNAYNEQILEGRKDGR